MPVFNKKKVYQLLLIRGVINSDEEYEVTYLHFKLNKNTNNKFVFNSNSAPKFSHQREFLSCPRSKLKMKYKYIYLATVRHVNKLKIQIF